eukprot:jgi/Mesvir1/16548/Mv10089-RA.1
MPPSAKDEVESHHRAQVQSLSSTSAGLQISGKDMTRTVVEIECIGLESGSPIFDDPFSSSLDLEQLGVARTKGELGAHVPMELVSPRTPEHVDRAIGPDAQRFGMRPSQRRLDFPVMDVAGTPDRTMAGKYATGDTPGRQRPLDIMCTPPNGCMSRSTSPTGQSLPPKPFRSRVASPVSGCALTRSNSAVEFSDGLDSSAHKRISADMMAEQQSRHVRTNSVDSYENGRRRSVGGDSNPFDRGRQPGESCNGGAHPIAPSGNFMESLVGLAQTLVGSNLLQDADSALAVSKIMMGMSELALSFSKQAAAANGTVAAAPEVVSPVKAAPPPETPPRVVMPSPNHGPLHVTPSYLGKSPPLHSFSPMPSFSQTPGLLAQALNSAPISPKNVAVSGGGSAPPRKARGFSLPCSPHLTPFGTPVGTPAATPGNSPRSAHDTPSGLAFKNLGGPPLHTLTEEQLEQRLKAAKAAADNARWKVGDVHETILIYKLMTRNQCDLYP